MKAETALRQQRIVEIMRILSAAERGGKFGMNDWNRDGKHDWRDGYVDYKLATSKNAPPRGKSGGGCSIGAVILVVCAICEMLIRLFD